MQKQYKLVTQETLNNLSKEAKISKRKRKNYNLHKLEDAVQKFFNALEPGTYVRPHRHLDPPKNETFILVQGSFYVIFFDNDGKVTNKFLISKESNNLAVDIAPGAWHSIIVNEPGTIFFEIKEGPYVALTDKDFATWAPEEFSNKVNSYLKNLEKICKN